MSGKTYTGQEITVPFIQEGTLKGFEIKGKSVQEIRSGKNKFDREKVYTSNMAILNTTGINILNCWATTIMNNTNVLTDLKPNTSYICTAKVKVISKPTTLSTANHQRLLLLYNSNTLLSTPVLAHASKNDWIIGTTYNCETKFTTPQDMTDYKLLGYTYHGNNDGSTTYAASGEFEITELMIREATVSDSSFELYGVSPSPSYPSEVQSVGEDINIFNKEGTLIHKPSYINLELLKTGLKVTQTVEGQYRYIAYKLDINKILGKTIIIKSDIFKSGENTPAILLYWHNNGTLTNRTNLTDLTLKSSGTAKVTIPSEIPEGSTGIAILFYSNQNGTGVVGDYVEYTNVKLQIGDVATTYSEYNKGAVEIRRYGINSLDMSKAKGGTTNGITCNINEDGSYSYVGTIEGEYGAVNIWLLGGYGSSMPTIFSLEAGTYYVKDCILFHNKTVVGNNNSIVTLKEKTNVTGVRAPSGTIGETYNEIKYPMIAKTNAKIEWEPYKGNNYIIQLSQPLRSLSNGVCDTIEKDGIHRRVGEVVLKGNENITAFNNIYYIRVPDKKGRTEITKGKILCSHFKETDKTGYNVMSIGEMWENYYTEPNVNIFFNYDNSVGGVDNFKDYLAEQYTNGTPVIVYYELAEEVIEPFEEQPQIKVYPGQNTFSLVNNNLETTMLIDTGEIVPVETQEMYALRDAQPNEGTSVSIEIWTHEDEFIDTLYNTDYEFEGQCIDPKITLNANGAKTLTLGLPLYIINKKTQEYIENPRWYYITQQYKIRVKQDENINEFVLKDYTESHDADDHLMININAKSLEEFELSQIGYNITFDENTLYKYNTNDDPNDPDTIPIGVYDADMHFWNEKLLENSEWKYRVESYYPVDKEMTTDNRQKINTELEYKNGPEQFYEEDRIIDYTEDNQPIKADAYEVKKRIIKVSKSNIFNIVQDICEAFECWPTFEIKYENEKIVEKTIVYKNDIPQDAKFSVNYQTNLNSIERIVDSSQIVTKMYVTPISNSNVDNGTITIATNPKNYMKENYLLDLSWYLGENRADTEISNAALINPNIGMTFERSDYTEPQFETTTTTNTKETIETYQKNIRNRNTYIENTSLKLSKDQQELINLKTEKEYVQSQKDSAQEIVNDLVDEISLIGTTELRKENKACYLYSQNGITIIRFSEIGIKSVPKAETFNTAINIVSNDGIPYYDEKQVPAGLKEDEWLNIKTLQLVPYKVDPIIGTILECQVLNAKVGTGTDADYASFKCSFDFDPYDYYKKLIAYWRAKIVTHENRLNVLGKSREEGGTSGLIYQLETEVLIQKQNIFQAQKEKTAQIKAFENNFIPYIREGYWENTDFGIYMNQNQSQEHIPDEKKVLKYGQTEDSASSETDKYEWSKDYICFKIPNNLIRDISGNESYLYNVIDINEIEVMNDNPLNANVAFATYIKGTDYTVDYGYSSATNQVSEEGRGIYVRFFKSELEAADGVLNFNADTQMYIRIKARGSNQFIWSGFVKPEFYIENGEQKRKWFCPLEQRITITDSDIILSSIKIKVNTQKINYDIENKLVIDNTQYELVYGKDYYTSKEIENGETVSRVTFYQTSNVPLMKFDTETNYTVEYNQDITAKYYYNDALEVMKESSVPQTTYNISVLDISEAENFLKNLKWYKPQVGTRVPIYDEELRFKGLVGFINSITFDLLNPQNTQLSITNFKDKFVDLFQKITASTIALQSKEYAYDRSTQIVTVEGGINETILKDTFEKPESTFKVSANSNVSWDYTGITSTSNILNENGVYAQMKVTSEGIFTANAKDAYGNYIWTTAITPQGINANQLTLGKLDTRQIQIFNSSEPRFLWNENGLYAYGQNEGKTDYETYVLYNENGIKFRQLMHNTNSVLLNNLVTAPQFNPISDWTTISTDGSIYTKEVIQEIEIEGGTTVSACQVQLATGKVSDNVTLALKSAKKDLLSDHKYYFRIYLKINGLPELSSIDINGGFSGFYKSVQFSQNNQYIKIDGFVTGVTNLNQFGVQVVLPNKIGNWSIIVKKPMIIDVTETFGETIPSLQWFNDLVDINDTYTWTTEMDVYGDSLKLDWGGLTIGAQNNSLQLTSENGLVIYHPITTETNNEKRMRLQLGQWMAPALDEFKNPIMNGTEIVYEELYGLRANDLNGNMIFQVTQRGVEFDFTSNLEETISNYAKTAALSAISSTSTANMLKNSCGYVYEEQKDSNGNPNGLYTFAEWDVVNTQFLFPINERYEEIDETGQSKMIVENTISRHAFKMTGSTEGNYPSIKQKINVASNSGQKQPFTFKFLMKASNYSESNPCGIHLEMIEVGNENDIKVDIPYIKQHGEWQVVKYTIRTEMPDFTIEIRNISPITYDDNGDIATGIIYLSDLMVTSGEDTPAWTVSPGEIYNNYVTIGSEGVVVTSEEQNGLTVRTVMDSHSFRVETINSNREISTNILVDEDNTTLGPTHVKGQFDVGAISRLRFIEYNDTSTLDINQKDSGVDITLIKG